MSETPRVGDKVRVTIEGTVDYEYKSGHWVFEPGYVENVDILDRADDPSKDPIGTLRGKDGWLLVRRCVVLGINPWVVIASPSSETEFGFSWTDKDVSDLPVIGVAPWSPADKSSWL